MKSIVIFTALLLLIGCNNSDDNSGEGVNLGDILISFSLQNSSNMDLLDPSVEGNFNTDSISLYEKIDGDYVLFENNQLAYPKGYIIDSTDGTYWFTPYYSDHRQYKHELRIDWGNGESDFIVVNLVDGDGDWRVATEVIYNDNIVWNENINPDGRFFTIVKE
ncbi:hypothetical protein [Zobellia uliginosa]|uniref:hypothetical protein n=1 Tax=Zobellia uliginosa TaxID=143224 RepID=UPI0026E279AD|nr:hypothetical protein [Zobellia uliginosa]MDO6517778.1 hypothetical protein [Zobellia uliginosa]